MTRMTRMTTSSYATRPERNGPDRLLRTVLRTDSASTAAFGVLLLAAGALFAMPLGMPRELAVPLGALMLFAAAALALLVRSAELPHGPVLGVIVVNALCAAAFALLAVTDLVPLTAFGRAFLIVGAVVVALFAELEYVGLRRIR